MWTVEKVVDTYPETLLAAAIHAFITTGCQPRDAGEQAATAVVACLNRYDELNDEEAPDEQV